MRAALPFLIQASWADAEQWIGYERLSQQNADTVVILRNVTGGEGPPDRDAATAPESDVMMMLGGLSDQLSADVAFDDEKAFDPETFLASPLLPVTNPCL